jgi:rhomboid protease GluP
MLDCQKCGKPFASSATANDVCPQCAAVIHADLTLSAQLKRVWKKSRPLRERVPWMTLLLAALTVATFRLQVSSKQFDITPSFDPVLLAVGMKGEAVFAGQWWRLITAIFVHENLYHLLSNLCFLLLFGSIAENVFHRTGYLALWFLSGIAGSVTQLVSLSPRAYGYGASGVAFGLVGALWSAYCVGRAPAPRGVRRWPIPILLGIFLILGFLPDWIHSHSFNSAHVGGMLAGMILGLVLPVRVTIAPATRVLATVAIAAVVFAGCAKLAHAKQEPLLEAFAIEDAHQGPMPLSPLEISKLEEILVRHPELTSVHLWLARAYSSEGRYNDAVHEYSFVLAANPQSFELWFESGRALLNAQRYPEAIVALSRSIDLLSSSHESARRDEIIAMIHEELAKAFELGGQMDKAIEVNRKILQADPNNVTAQDNLKRLLAITPAPLANSNPQPPLATPPSK